MTGKIHNISDWASSAGKRDIALFSSHKLLEMVDLNPILFIGGVHGDEPEGVRLAQELLAHITGNKVEYRPWVLIPCINPDGLENQQRTNANGVDLNRNFPSQCWSDQYEKDRYYPGASPGSEPETKALVNLIEKLRPQLIIHFHSWKPMIVYTNKKAETAATLLAHSSGYFLKEDIGYPTPGSLGEYAGNDLDIGVICIEEQDHLDEKQMDEIFPRFRNPLLEILKKPKLS